MAGLVTIAAGTLCAQQGRISGPTSGLVFDRSSRSVRPVLGVPGGSTIGAPLNFGRELASAWVSPQLDSAIGVAADGSLHFFRIDAGIPLERPFDGISGAAHSVTFSPSGTAAALSSAKGTYVITGLPDAPKVMGTVGTGAAPRRGTPASLGARPTAAQRISTAISDDGAYVLWSAGGSVSVLTVSGENRRLSGAADAVVAFSPRSHDAAVADSEAGLIVFRDLAGAATPQIISAITAPTAIAFSPDGGRLYVASATAHAVTAFDIQAGAQKTIACDCSPASLLRMGSVYRLNELGRDPLWVLDAEAADPRIVFVPALVN